MPQKKRDATKDYPGRLRRTASPCGGLVMYVPRPGRGVASLVRYRVEALRLVRAGFISQADCDACFSETTNDWDAV